MRLPFRSAAAPSYEQLVGDVMGHRTPDALAVMWAHQIAWRQAPHGDEAQQLRATAERYGLDWREVLREQASGSQPVVPARRSGSPDVIRSG